MSLWQRLGAGVGERAAVAVLALTTLVALFAGASVKEIHGTAIFYASLAREIADGGDPLAPFRGDDAYLLKPPLMIWLTAAAVEVYGPTSFAGTLFARLSGVAVVLATWALGRRLFGPAAGWFAALVLVTNSTFHQFSTALRMDALMSAGLLLALLGYLHGARRWGPWALFGGVAIGVLAKGPQAFAVLALIGLHALAAGTRPVPVRRWGAGASLLLAPLAWYAWLYGMHGARVWSELAADAARGAPASAAAQLVSAWSEYGVKPLRRFWPWLPFMLLALAGGVRRLCDRAAPRSVRADVLLLLAWIGIVFAASALKPDHDVRYLYPALPAIAVLTGWLLARLCAGRVPAWVVLLVLAGAAAAMGAAAVPGLLFQDTRPAIAATRAHLDAVLAPGQAVRVVGFHENNPPGPRRQSTHVDWVHYYLGRPARVVAPEKADAAMLAAEPLVLVARYGDREAVLADLKLELLVEGQEMVLAVPRRPGS